jgi:two-component system CheB/CheR fusion protein
MPEHAGTPAALEESVTRRAMRLVESYAPAYVVIDEHQDVLRFSGRTGKYIQPSAGAASLNLFNLLEAGLRSEVRAALHKAMTIGRKVVHENVFVAVNGGRQSLNIVIEPVPAGDGSGHFFVVLFQDVGPVKTGDAAEPRPGTDAEKNEAIVHLETELLATRERLQTTVEELETANEEMKASNEEFQSVNEELQSSNEELETSKEELQSVNEELETVNSELNSKVDGLERAMSDRKNLLESTQIATLFLDDTLRIKSFTPAIIDIFHLIETDYGRPITDIVTRLAYDGLERDVRKVLRTLSRIEQEVGLADGGATYVMRILPYRTIDNVIGGVVITFVDITERKRNEESLARLASIVATSDEAIIGMALDGTITTWNAGAQRIYGYTAEEAVAQSWSMLMPGERSTDLRAMVEDIKRSRSATITDAERLAKGGKLLHVATTVSPIRGPGGQVIGLSSVERDITQRKQDEERQRLLLAELNHRVKNTLATVQSIASQTLRQSGSIEAFQEAFEGRIAALAKAHDLLAASHWQGTDLREMLVTALAPYREPGDHLAIEGAPTSLAPDAAFMLGMAFHELGTNAARHGAFAIGSGRVEVAWKSDSRRQLLKIDWIERGVPKAEHSPRKGFGLTLIERGLAQELQGRATFDFSDGGLHCSLEIPLAEVQHSPPPGARRRDR